MVTLTHFVGETEFKSVNPGHSLLLLDDELPEPRLVDVGVRADALQTRALQHDTVINNIILETSRWVI